jgi:hypothetical protein
MAAAARAAVTVGEARSIVRSSATLLSRSDKKHYVNCKDLHVDLRQAIRIPGGTAGWKAQKGQAVCLTGFRAIV